MKPEKARRVAWGLVGVAVVLLAARFVLGSYTGSLTDQGGFFYIVLFVFLIFAFVVPGAFIISRQPRNTIGWLLIAIPLMGEIAFFMGDYATYALVTRPGGLPAARWAAWIDRWDIVPTLASFIPLFLLFPDGRVPSRRWRPVLWFTVAAIAVATLSFAVTPGQMTGAFSDLTKVRVTNPLGLDGLGGLVNGVSQLAGFATLAAAFLAGASLVVRFRSRRGDERQQVKWLAFVGVAFLIAFVLNIVGISLIFPGETHASETAGNIGFGVMFFILAVGIPIACAMAILKYRLYDLDVVINKTLVYALLAAFITAVYVGIVVGIGQAIGSKRSLGLSILATAVVAIGFQPVRDRVQHLANRLVYGKRATPYEVLSEFSERMSDTYATEDLLPRMARILAEGTGASAASVWLKVGDELRPEASWPSDAPAPGSVPTADGELPSIEGVDRSLPVRHQGELLGALTVTKSRGDPLRPAEEKLMEDLASGAGLVLRNVRLTEDLLEHLREIQSSRQRIVAAQDEERRRLERNLHDGAQQQLVALQVKLSLAERIAEEGCRVRDQLGALKQEATDALENLRDLARGIYPPLLADQGLQAALSSQARKATFPVSIDANGIGRYPQEAEAALYFCVLEALQNVAKYAGATQATVTLHERDGELSFEVQDDGAGFDSTKTSYGTGLQGMADRLSAQGGDLQVRSTPGEGTTVFGRVPVAALETVG